MKIRSVLRTRASGSVLLICLVMSAIIGITLASYLLLVENRSKGVARSQMWNNAMVVTEAGIEDALQFMNKYVGTPNGNIIAWTNDWNSDGWSFNGVNVYSTTRTISPGVSYTVYITNIWVTPQLNAPIIRCTGQVPGPTWLAGTAPPSMVAAGGAGSLNSPIARTVVVQTRLATLFNVAMAALGTIDFKGNGVASDSFDSSDPLYSTDGLYDPLKRKAGGDVVTNNTITNSTLNVGNANIAGHISVGPNGSFGIGPNGSVGDIPWVTTTTGIKPGWANHDMNVTFADVVLPTAGWIGVGSTAVAGQGGSGTVNGVNYDHVFLSTGDYAVSDSGTIYVGTNIVVRIKMTASTFNPNYIYVAGTGAQASTLKVYMLGQSATLGTDDKAQSGRATNLRFYGLPSCTDLSYKGNGDFTGVIYAPEADFHLAGGGSSDMDFVGSSVTRTVQMNGHYHFHYDERLRFEVQDNAYVANYWKEL